MSRILVGPHSIDAHLARSNSASVQAQLREVWSQRGRVLCLCAVPPRKLVIRSRASHLHLAVWPQDGPRHDPDCPFHRLAAEGLEDLRSGAALVENADGFEIRADFQLQRDLQRQPEPRSPVPKVSSAGAAAHSTDAAARSRMPLLGLLHYLWDAARLNRWGRGWRRDYWRVVHELNEVALHGRLGDRPLNECLFIQPPYRLDRVAENNALFEAFLAPLRREADEDAVRSGLLLAQLGGVRPTSRGWRIALRHTPEPVFMSEGLHAKLTRRHIREMAAANAPAGSPTLALGLLHVELTQRGRLQLLDAALMATSRDYIPVDSTFEAQVAHELVRLDRSFFKPLHFAGPREGDFPDFVLLDTAPPTCVEIFGASTTRYLQHKDQKIRQHQTRGDRAWIWNAAGGEPLPALPPAKPRKAPVANT